MAVSLERRAALPVKEAARSKRYPKGAAGLREFKGKKPEPEHLKPVVGREVASEEKKQLIFGTSSAEENDRPTLIPEPGSQKAERVKEILNEEKPTFRPPSKSSGAKPATEDLMLSSESEVSKSTNSYAPPPLPSIVAESAVAEVKPPDEVEIEFDDVVVEIERPSVIPEKGVWRIRGDLDAVAVGQN